MVHGLKHGYLVVEWDWYRFTHSPPDADVVDHKSDHVHVVDRKLLDWTGFVL